MADVFVSYKAEDRARVKPLVSALEADGFSLWWDVRIGGAAEWRDSIETELNRAKCVIVTWSTQSVGRSGTFVRDEASRALENGTYLPIRIDDCRPPLGFGETQALSLVGWKGRRSDQRYQSVLDAVRSLVFDIPPVAGPDDYRPIVSRRVVLSAGAVAAVAATAGGWFALRPKAAASSNRIAVLPFANLSGDPAQAYFSDGIAEELRSSLSRIGMQVIGRTSSDAVRNMDAKAVAAKLGVSNILTGSVRRSSTTIRIDAQLVSGSDGVERWAQTYDRAPGDTIKIQTDIAESVASALSVTLGQAGRTALTVGGTANPAAQDLVLKAARTDADDDVSIDRNLALLDAALSIDPNYSEAYAERAFWLMLKADNARTANAASRGLAEALATANRSIAIAPKMATGYAYRALIYREQLQLGLALADARRALAMPGKNDAVFGIYAIVLRSIGEFPEALRSNAEAISLDPLSAAHYSSRANILYFARRYREAVDNARRSLQLAPNLGWARGILGDSLLLQGKTSEAQSELGKLGQDSRLFGEALVATRAGQRSQALGTLDALRRRDGDRGHYRYAQIYAQLGMTDAAFQELELAWSVRDPGLGDLRGDPFLDPLRRDLRFAALDRKIGLP